MIVKAEATCNKCNRTVRGTITIENAKIVDSDGFMIFENEAVCDTCLGDVPHRKIWRSTSRNSGNAFGKKEMKITSLESRIKEQDFGWYKIRKKRQEEL